MQKFIIFLLVMLVAATAIAQPAGSVALPTIDGQPFIRAVERLFKNQGELLALRQNLHRALMAGDEVQVIAHFLAVYNVRPDDSWHRQCREEFLPVVLQKGWLTFAKVRHNQWPGDWQQIRPALRSWAIEKVRGFDESLPQDGFSRSFLGSPAWKITGGHPAVLAAVAETVQREWKRPRVLAYLRWLAEIAGEDIYQAQAVVPFLVRLVAATGEESLRQEILPKSLATALRAFHRCAPDFVDGQGKKDFASLFLQHSDWQTRLAGSSCNDLLYAEGRKRMNSAWCKYNIATKAAEDEIKKLCPQATAMQERELALWHSLSQPENTDKVQAEIRKIPGRDRCSYALARLATNPWAAPFLLDAATASRPQTLAAAIRLAFCLTNLRRREVHELIVRSWSLWDHSDVATLDALSGLSLWEPLRGYCYREKNAESVLPESFWADLQTWINHPQRQLRDEERRALRALCFFGIPEDKRQRLGERLARALGERQDQGVIQACRLNFFVTQSAFGHPLEASLAFGGVPPLARQSFFLPKMVEAAWAESASEKYAAAMAVLTFGKIVLEIDVTGALRPPAAKGIQLLQPLLQETVRACKNSPSALSSLGLSLLVLQAQLAHGSFPLGTGMGGVKLPWWPQTIETECPWGELERLLRQPGVALDWSGAFLLLDSELCIWQQCLAQITPETSLSLAPIQTRTESMETAWELLRHMRGDLNIGCILLSGEMSADNTIAAIIRRHWQSWDSIPTPAITAPGFFRSPWENFQNMAGKNSPQKQIRKKHVHPPGALLILHALVERAASLEGRTPSDPRPLRKLENMFVEKLARGSADEKKHCQRQLASLRSALEPVDVDGFSENRWPTTTPRAINEAISADIAQLKKIREALALEKGQQQIGELLRLPLVVDVAGMQAELKAAIAEIREAEALLGASQSESLAAEMEVFVAGLVSKVQKLELKRAKILLEIEEKEIKRRELGVEIAELQKKIDKLKQYPEKNAAEIFRLEKQKTARKREKIDISLRLYARSYEAVRQQIGLLQELIVNEKEWEDPRTHVKRKVAGRLGIIAATTCVHVEEKIKEIRSQRSQFQSQLDSLSRRRIGGFLKSALRIIGSVVGYVIGGPFGMQVGALIGGAVGEAAAGIIDGKPFEDILVGLLDDAVQISGTLGFDIGSILNQAGSELGAKISEALRSIDQHLSQIFSQLPAFIDKSILLKAVWEVSGVSPPLENLLRNIHHGLSTMQGQARELGNIGDQVLCVINDISGRGGSAQELIEALRQKVVQRHIDSMKDSFANTKKAAHELGITLFQAGETAKLEEMGRRLTKLLVAKALPDFEKAKGAILRRVYERLAEVSESKPWSQLEDEVRKTIIPLFMHRPREAEAIVGQLRLQFDHRGVRAQTEQLLVPWHKELAEKMSKAQRILGQTPQGGNAKERLENSIAILDQGERALVDVCGWLESTDPNRKKCLRVLEGTLQAKRSKAAELEAKCKKAEIDLGINDIEAKQNILREAAQVMKIKIADLFYAISTLAARSSELNLDKAQLEKQRKILQKRQEELRLFISEKEVQRRKHLADATKYRVKAAEAHLESAQAHAEALRRRLVTMQQSIEGLKNSDAATEFFEMACRRTLLRDYRQTVAHACAYVREMSRLLRMAGIEYSIPIASVRADLWEEVLRKSLKLLRTRWEAQPVHPGYLYVELEKDEIEQLFGGGLDLFVYEASPEEYYRRKKSQTPRSRVIAVPGQCRCKRIACLYVVTGDQAGRPIKENAWHLSYDYGGYAPLWDAEHNHEKIIIANSVQPVAEFLGVSLPTSGANAVDQGKVLKAFLRSFQFIVAMGDSPTSQIYQQKLTPPLTGRHTLRVDNVRGAKPARVQVVIVYLYQESK